MYFVKIFYIYYCAFLFLFLRAKEKETHPKKKKKRWFSTPFGRLDQMNVAGKPALFSLANSLRSNNARLLTPRACAKHNSECKRLGKAQQEWTAEQSEDVEILRGFSFFTPLSFFLPRKQKERKWQNKKYKFNKIHKK